MWLCKFNYNPFYKWQKGISCTLYFVISYILHSNSLGIRVFEGYERCRFHLKIDINKFSAMHGDNTYSIGLMKLWTTFLTTLKMNKCQWLFKILFRFFNVFLKYLLICISISLRIPIQILSYPFWICKFFAQSF